MLPPSVTLLVLALAPAAALAERDACTSSWAARIVDADTAEPIPGARVAMRSEGSSETRHAESDVEGRVRVEGVCAGPMRVNVVESDHEAAHVIVEVGASETAPSEVVLEIEALHGHHDAHVIVVHDDGNASVGASESLSGAALARTRGQGLADALEGMAGVAVLRGTAGGMGKPIIRGQFGRRNLILFDGIRHEGQDWGLDHAPEVDANAADRITVVKGAGTTRYGADGSGGVVLLEPRPLPRQPTLSGEVGTVGFSNPLGGGGSARIDYAPAKARGLALRVEGNVSRHRAALTPDYALDNTGAYTWNAGTKLGWASERVDVEVGYRVMRQRLGICTCLQISTPEEFQRGIARARPVNADLYRADFAIERAKQEITHHLAFARTRASLGRAGELHAVYAFQYDARLEYEVVRDSVSGPQYEFGLATHTLELGLEHAALRMREWTLVGTLGATLLHQRNEFESAATLIPDYQQLGWGVYDIERFVHERVELELGARYEGMHRVTTLDERDFLGQQAGGRLDANACRATIPGDTPNPSDAGGRCVHDFNTASATLGLLARPLQRSPDSTLRVQLDSSARIPAIDEQFMNGAAPSFPLLGVGSSRIGIERSFGGELSLHAAGPWWFVEAAAFGTFIDDYIYFVPEQQEGQCAPLTCTTRGPLPVFAFETLDALFGGGELRFELRAPRLPFGLSGMAAWVRARDLGSDAPLSLLPADRYALNGRYFLPDTEVSARAYLELGGTIVDRQRHYVAGLDFAPPPPAYVLLGAGAGVEFPTQGELVRLSLVGTNLLNMRYRDYNSLLRYFADEPGWGLQLRVSVEFDA